MSLMKTYWGRTPARLTNIMRPLLSGREGGYADMKKVQILLQDMKRAQQLADFLTPIPGDFFLVSGSSVANAKSLIGILALKMGEPVELRIVGCSKEDEEKVLDKLRDGFLL